MKKTHSRIFAAAIFGVALIPSTYVIATTPARHTHTSQAEHGGGLDRFGCHHDHIHGGYHCH